MMDQKIEPIDQIEISRFGFSVFQVENFRQVFLSVKSIRSDKNQQTGRPLLINVEVDLNIY